MIPEKLTYLFVDIFAIIFPFIFSFTNWFDFKNYWKFYIPANLFVALAYIFWDSLYTYLGVWGFNHNYTIGIKFFNLPIEELAFFICIPYACLFTYYCFSKFIFRYIKFDFNQGWLFFAFIFFIFGILFFSKLYTSAAFISSAISFLIAYKMKHISFSHFISFYLVILIPFFIFNGILTGSFLDRVVVYYNNHQNLGIRLMTIPLEDTFYGMGLLLFNVIGFEYLKLKGNKS